VGQPSRCGGCLLAQFNCASHVRDIAIAARGSPVRLRSLDQGHGARLLGQIGETVHPKQFNPERRCRLRGANISAPSGRQLRPSSQPGISKWVCSFGPHPQVNDGGLGADVKTTHQRPCQVR
jgi:hypothetical protein